MPGQGRGKGHGLRDGRGRGKGPGLGIGPANMSGSGGGPFGCPPRYELKNILTLSEYEEKEEINLTYPI